MLKVRYKLKPNNKFQELINNSNINTSELIAKYNIGVNDVWGGDNKVRYW